MMRKGSEQTTEERKRVIVGLARSPFFAQYLHLARQPKMDSAFLSLRQLLHALLIISSSSCLIWVCVAFVSTEGRQVDKS